MWRASKVGAGWAIWAICLVGSTGCAASRPAVQGPARAGATFEVAPLVVSPYADAELRALFEKANALLLADKFAEAAEAFDRLVRLSPDGEVAAPSLFNGGVAHEALAARTTALDRYRTFLQRFPEHPMAKNAEVRQARLLGHLERWDDLARTAARLQGRRDLTVIEAIEAHGLRGLALVEKGEIDEAGKAIMKGRDLIEQHRLGEAGRPPVELASVSFALAELRRAKSERVTFVPVPQNFGDVLEQRCTGLLEAQDAYTEAMRSMNSHWSAMAGFRIGQLYQHLHRDVMRVPPPSKADTLKRKQLFEGAMRLRYRVLLEKGLKMMEGTVKLGERTGEDSAWIARARESKRVLELALEDERAAMGKLPYTEAELGEALEALRK